MIFGVAMSAFSPISKFISKFVKNDSELGIKLDDVKKEAQLMIDKHKLAEKGFSAEIIEKSMFENISEEEKKALEAIRKDLIETKGGGAVYRNNNIINIALAVEEKASLIFHEIGHAVQYNNSKIGKLLNKLKIDKTINIAGKPIPLYAITSGLILGLGLNYKDPKKLANQNYEKDSLEYKINEANKKNNKFYEFIKNNAGLLTFASFAPILLDEGFATKHALKHLKEIKSYIHAPLKKNLSIAYLTYLSLATIMALGVKGGLMLKEKLTKSQPANQENSN